MKNSPTKFQKFVLITGICISTGLIKVYAQGPPDDGGPTPTEDPPPTEIPIDGGASLLLAGGVAYGLKKLRDRRKTR